MQARRLPLMGLAFALVAMAMVALPAPASAVTEATKPAEKPAPVSSPKAATDTTDSGGSDADTTPDKPTKKSFEDQPLSKSISEGNDTAKESKESDSGGALGRMVFGLLFVLGVIYAVHWLLKRYGNGRSGSLAGGAGGVIDVIATTPLAPNRALHLVRVGDEVVLIGATDQSITQLRSFDPAASASATVSAVGGEDFARALQGQLSGGGFTTSFGASQVAGMSTSSTPQPTNDTFVRRLLANLQMMTAR